VGVHHPAKHRFGVGRHNSHFRNSNVANLHQYSHDRMSRLLLNSCLYCFFSLGTAVKLEKKKKKKKISEIENHAPAAGVLAGGLAYQYLTTTKAGESDEGKGSPGVDRKTRRPKKPRTLIFRPFSVRSQLEPLRTEQLKCFRGRPSALVLWCVERKRKF